MLRKYTAYFIELNLVLPPGFEPGCSAREAEMMGRTTLQELIWPSRVKLNNFRQAILQFR